MILNNYNIIRVPTIGNNLQWRYTSLQMKTKPKIIQADFGGGASSTR